MLLGGEQERGNLGFVAHFRNQDSEEDRGKLFHIRAFHFTALFLHKVWCGRLDGEEGFLLWHGLGWF